VGGLGRVENRLVRALACDRGVVTVESDYRSTNLVVSNRDGTTLSPSFVVIEIPLTDAATDVRFGMTLRRYMATGQFNGSCRTPYQPPMKVSSTSSQRGFRERSGGRGRPCTLTCRGPKRVIASAFVTLSGKGMGVLLRERIA